tara:strand:+ start:4873 stop:5286 length:414 start_codon:yes stop_codon:yes gene_type:complete
MNATLKNILAVIVGLIIGSIVNMGIIMISSSVIPPPNGADVTTMEGLKEVLHLFEPKHFLFPFLAHALGTLVGAIVASKIAKTKKKTMALVVGCIFLIFGITNVFLLAGPMWFNAVDVIFAYIPMALLGYKISNSKE